MSSHQLNLQVSIVSSICGNRSELMIIQDEDTSFHQIASLHALGEISIEIWRVAIEGTKSDPDTTFPDEQKVNEREKKALVHRAKFSLKLVSFCTSDSSAK